MVVVPDDVSSQDLSATIAELHQNILGFLKSMALKCAVDLGIPDAIHRRGGAATLADIAADTGVHRTKLHDLQGVMRVLTASGMFGATTPAEDDGHGDTAYALTSATAFFVGPHSLSPALNFCVNPTAVTPFFGMHKWLRSGPEAAKSLFEMAHGCSRWEMASKDAADNAVFNGAMVADTNLTMEVILRYNSDVFRGLGSLVDLGGGHGAAAQAILRAFPDVKCTVMDLPHVIENTPAGNSKLQFIAGDAFQSNIPRADAVLLKNVLHCWGHDECVKVLRRCKDAIPSRDAGGKVIIIEMVTASTPHDKNNNEADALRNIFMMYINGVERDEHAWKKIFSDAGFSDCKFIQISGPLSVIEVYP